MVEPKEGLMLGYQLALYQQTRMVEPSGPEAGRGLGYLSGSAGAPLPPQEKARDFSYRGPLLLPQPARPKGTP